jgi:nucleoside-diphosphate-sugar epimerase
VERALLTGVTGFVGSHLAAALVDDGVEVHAIVRSSARLDRIPDLVDRLVLHVDDDGGSLQAAVARANPDATFHLATRFLAVHAASDIPDLIDANVTFGTRLLDAVSDTGGGFVNVGTAWQHVEGAPYRPKNLYAATKQAFEAVLAHYVQNERLNAVTVNLFDTYGPRDHRGKLVSALIEAARHGRTLEMSRGMQLVDLVEVSDVVCALRLAARQAAAPAPTHAVSSGAPVSIRDLVERLDRLLPAPIEVAWGARPDRDGEMTSPWDAGPAVPGWSPTVSLDDGLQALLEEPGSLPSDAG